MRKKLLRLLRLVPIALAFWGFASAQTTSTIIGVVTDAATGKAVAGALIVATSPNLQGEQTALSGDDGSYRLDFLPPGPYKLAVQLQGYKPAERSDILLRVDKTLRANLTVVPEAVQMEEQVVRTGVPPVVNVGSAETGALMSREFVASVPIGRDFQAAAIVTPTAQQDILGINFAGGQSPENNYILDGLNVTNPGYGYLGTNILSNFVQELDVKTGSFMPEYGRASGGIINAAIGQGSNEYHGSVWGNWTPGYLQPDFKAIGRVGEALAIRRTPSEGGYDIDFGFEIGGPITKDKLWFYGGLAPVLRGLPYTRFVRLNQLDASGNVIKDSSGVPVQVEAPGFSQTHSNASTQYQLVGKLTYLVDENHNLTFSGIYAPANDSGIAGANGFITATRFANESNAVDLIARYNGKLAQKQLLLEAVAGWHHQIDKAKPGTVTGTGPTGAPITIDQGATPLINWGNGPAAGIGGGITTAWNLAAFEPAPAECSLADGSRICPVRRYLTGGYGYIGNDTLDRLAGRLALSYLFSAAGNHNVKGGVDLEANYYERIQKRSGLGQFQLVDGYGFVMVRSYGVINAPGFGTLNPNEVTYYDSHARVLSSSTGYFLQDSWNIMNQVTLNFGVRLETQTMKDRQSAASPELDITDNWAPRVQAIWDFTGQGRGKIAGGWGRYYESIPLDVGTRSFGAETQIQADFLNCYGAASTPTSSALDPRTQCPVIPDGYVDLNGNPVPYATYSAVTALQPNVKGQFVDQFSAQAEYEVLPDLSVGAVYEGRRIGSVIEDYSPNDGGTFYIGNVGSGATFTDPRTGATVSTSEVQGVDYLTGRTFTATLRKPERSFDSVSFVLRKNLSNHWQAQGSYTWSSLRGNYAGLIRQETGQLDPNITSEYDLPSLLANKVGPLPGDRTHSVRAYGAYVFDLGPGLNVTAGGAFRGQSGIPVSFLGRHKTYGPSEVFVLPRGDAGNLPFTAQLDLHGGVAWKFSPPYAIEFTLDIFNVFNTQEKINVDQAWTDDRTMPITGGVCNSRNAIEKSDPIAGALADCPQLAYLKTTDGRPVTINPNFGRPIAIPGGGITGGYPYQLPISFRLGAKLTF